MKKAFISLAAIGLFALASCGGAAQTTTVETIQYTGTSSYKLYADAYEFGPAYTRIMVTFDADVDASSLSTDTFTVKAQGTKRTIKSIYLSDEDGNEVTGSSKTVCMTMRTGYSAVSLACVESSSAFTTDENSHSVWLEGGYTVELAQGQSVTIGGKTYNSLSVGKDAYAGRMCPAIDGKITKGKYEDESYEIYYGAYETASMKSDSGKNALICWFHGSGETGSDITVAYTGAEATNLYGDEIQQYFKKDGLEGAYVLVLQSPINWIGVGGEEGSGADYTSQQDSAIAAIKAYCEENGDIDMDRIYVGGCSSGGYMTVNTVKAYPDFFAAAYPVCAGSSTTFTEEDAESLKNLPMWWTHSYDDQTVNPSNATSVYKMLVDAGAKDQKFSMFEHVRGSEFDVQYYGHWSWVYTLQNRCTLTVDNEAVKAASDDEALAEAMKVSTVETGTSLFEWMSNQKKTSAE